MDGMDFSMPSMEFESGDLQSLIADYPMDHDLSLPRSVERRQGDRDGGARRFSYEDLPPNNDTSNTSLTA